MVINVGVSGGVVKKHWKKFAEKDLKSCVRRLKDTFKVTRVGQLVAGEASQRLGIPFGIVDLSLAPTRNRRQRCGNFGRNRLGKIETHWEQRLLLRCNDQVKKRSYGIFLCRRFEQPFIPVSEDQGMIDAVHRFTTLEKLKAMTCVCC